MGKTEKYSTWRLLAWIWRASRGARLQALMSALIGVVSVVCSLCFVFLSKETIDIATGVRSGELMYYGIGIPGGEVTGIGQVKADGLRVWSENGVLYVVSDIAQALPLYSADGRMLRTLAIQEGKNIIEISGATKIEITPKWRY